MRRFIELRPPSFVASLLAISSFGAANGWICDSLSLAQISPYGETSHIFRTLWDIVLKNYIGGEKDEKS